MANPILKWAGGKRQLLDKIISLFPSEYSSLRYHEPFFGGGAVFFKITPKTGTINDVNHRLMNLYKVVRDSPDELISLAKTYVHNKEVFYQLRERFNQPDLTDVENAALLLYLNKTAFNGLYRVNSKDKFNVPFGSYKNPKIVDEKRIHEASVLFQDIEILCTDFTYVEETSVKGDLVYFDPPYLPVSDTAHFTSYARDGFSYDDQIRLRDTCVKLDEKGVHFVLSNSYVKPLIEKYEEIDAFQMIIVQANRAINSKGSARGPINEILVTNIPDEARGTRSTLDPFVER